jgi:hypothetical protein
VNYIQERGRNSSITNGLIVSLIGLLLAFLASEVTVIAVLSKALALPQGVAVYRPENVIRSLDLLVVLANVNLIGSHLIGGATSLGLLNWLGSIVDLLQKLPKQEINR